MRTLKKYMLYITLATVTFACKKEHLQQGTNTGSPVFYFNGNVNSQTVSLQAGVSNYYMYSSYTQDNNNVYNYTGTLQQVGCSGCANSIKITVNDYRTLASGASEPNIGTALATGNYVYNSSGKILTGFTATYTAQPDPLATVSSYNWSFGDGSTSASANPTHTFLSPGAYGTTLTVTYTGGSASASDSLGFGTPSTIIHPTLSYTSTIDTANHIDSVLFTAVVSGGTPPYTYNWNFGNGTTTGTAASILHTYTLPANIYNTSVKVTDKNGYSAIVHKNVDANKDTALYSNFTVNSITPDSSINSSGLSIISIVYIDASGDVYSSANVNPQPPSSSFKILSESAYQNNENNQLTRQLHVQFTCTLKDASGKTIPITNGDAVIAVAYK